MILDTLTILFQADAKNLKQGLEGSRQETDKLNKSLSESDDLAKKVTGNMGSALAAVAALAAGFIAAGAAGASIAKTADELNTIGRTSESLGVAVEDVDAFSRSLVAMGGDAQGARDSLVDMAESIGEAIQDAESGRAKAYASLGVHLKDVNGQAITATEGMLRLSDAVKGMSKQEAIFRIKELGITDNRTVELILKGRKEMERMLAVQKEQSAVTKESVENAAKYKEALGRLNNAQDAISTQIAATVLPALTKVIDVVSRGVEWLRSNSDTVIAFFGAIAAAVTVMYLPAMISAAAATLAATWPIVAAAAVVTTLATAFALLYDDVQNFLSGNDSLIGQISEKYPIIGETVKAVAQVIGDAWEGLKAIGLSLWEMIQPMGEAVGGAFSIAGDTVMAFFDLFKNVVKAIGNLIGVDLNGSFKFAGDFIGGVMKGIMSVVQVAVSFITGAFKIVGTVLSGIGSAVRAVSSMIGAGKEGAAAENSAQAGSRAVSSANSSGLNNTTSSAISNTNNASRKETNVSVGQVTVQTQATDAKGIAGDVGGALTGQLKQMDNEFSSGVER